MAKIKHIIRHESNGLQPWVVYRVEGKRESWQCAFSARVWAEEWVERHGGSDIKAPK